MAVSALLFADPDECGHSTPVRGVMAHEFAHYDGAHGPEGWRRTVTYYGPVVGGLPIQAWHCEDCGLLRLSYPDGRRDERRLYPGTQPGLLAPATPDAPEQLHYGMQPRVSGLSVSGALVAEFAAAAVSRPRPRRLQWLARLGIVTSLTVFALVLIAAGLVAAGILAVYDYTTPAQMGALVIVLLGLSAAVVILQIGGAVGRHLFPPGRLSPSPAVALRARPHVSGATRAAVLLLSVTALGLLVAGILAVYDYTTPAAEWPVVIASLATGAGALLIVAVAAVAGRWG